MNKTALKVAKCIVVIGTMTYLAASLHAVEQVYLSPSAVAADRLGKTLYIAEATAKQVAIFDTESNKVTGTISVPAEPTALALSADGKRLYVTCAEPAGHLCIIDTSAKAIRNQMRVGYWPASAVLSPRGDTLYVCNRFSSDVWAIDVDGLAPGPVPGAEPYPQVAGLKIAKVPVLREPIAADVTPDGKWLFVGNHLPDGPADVGPVACKVSVINTQTMKVDVHISLPNGSTALGDVTVSPDGRYVYVSHMLGRYTLPTTQLERGWMNTSALSIIDAENRTLLDTVLLDDVDNGAADPWAVACTGDGKYVCVTHAGTGELSIIDAAALLDKIRKYHADQKKSQNQPEIGSYGADATPTSDICNQLSFLYGIRQRVKLSGKGPRALAVLGDRLYVAEYFSDSLAVVDSRSGKAVGYALHTGPSRGQEMTTVRKGEMLFHDATVCFQKWQSCSSCHPSGRADGLNWDLLNDGIGNPKNTKSLLLAHATPPAMAMGVRDGAEDAVRAGFKHILFAVPTEEEAAAVDEYLKALKPVPSPYLVDGQLSARAARGKEIFDRVGCASCHSGPLYTDMKMYDVGTGRGLDKDRQFDTPSLVEVWRTAPYLHDGRAVTMKEVLTIYNRQDKHGVTSNLTESEIEDLAEFVLSQ
jgi:DNA-binding beta-propeller fold protein YncE